MTRILVIGARSHSKSLIAALLLEASVREVVMDVQIPFSGHPLDNVVSMSKRINYEQRDYRFNAEPEKSTFTRKINRSTKRW